MKNISWFKFDINKEILVVVLSWCAVVATLYTAFQIFTTKMVAANFITFGFGTILFCGICLPLAYIIIIKGESLAMLGIGQMKLSRSIILGILLAVVQYSQTLINVTLPEFPQLVPLVTMALAVGLFENIFFRGWLQQRFEAAFGLVPSLLLASVFYSLYHIGYGMTWSEMYVLFYVGFFFAVVFRFTQNIFVLYPFLTPTGALYTNIKEGLSLPFEAAYGFVIVIVLSVMAIVLFSKANRFAYRLGGLKNV